MASSPAVESPINGKLQEELEDDDDIGVLVEKVDIEHLVEKVRGKSGINQS